MSSNIHQNGDDGLRLFGKGMIDIQSQPGLALVVASVACLTGVFALCICCRKKSNMQQEDNDLYDQDVFDQDSLSSSHCQQLPTACKSNQTQREAPSARRQEANRPLKSEINWSYQNFSQENGIFEATYVHPLPDALYANDHDSDSTMMDQSLNNGTYENIFPTVRSPTVMQHDSDSSNYENCEVWARKYEEEEPDYVNTE